MEYTEKQLSLRPKLEAANINADSFLATDYLNHFNEIVMLLEMIPDMPDMLEDCLYWKPLTYDDHFNLSGFTAKELAIEAYANAPSAFKTPFEQIIGELDILIAGTINGLQATNVLERGVSPQARHLIESRTSMMQDYLAKMNRLIHGNLLEDSIDLFESTPTEEEVVGEEYQSQEDIDALFD